MKELVVISGKGGTGKTSLTASLACLAGNAVVADCDVDAADLHLLFRPRNPETHDFSGGHLARIDEQRCTGCGRCAEVCRFRAVLRDGQDGAYRIDPIACEGCKVCVALCPARAIDFVPRTSGQWFVSETRVGPLVHARLGPAQENSGKLVTVIRRRAAEIAHERGRPWLIVDGSPGVGCPVIASLTGADVALIVTEPTVSGRHDLQRVALLCAQLKVPARVCINKADLCPSMTDRIRQDVQARGGTVVGELPYDEVFTQAQMTGRTLVEYSTGGLADRIQAIWRRIVDAAG